MSYGRSIAGRVRALERQTRQRGSCPICGGLGAQGLVFRFADEPPLREPEPCPGCGKSAHMMIRIVVAAPAGTAP